MALTENFLIRSPTLGVLQKQASALVFHYGEYSSSSSFRPNELSFLPVPALGLYGQSDNVLVDVLVSPSNLPNLTTLYSRIPGVTVRPFMLHPRQLSTTTMLALMAVDQTQFAPLYMAQVTKILRQMAAKSSGGFDYKDFRRRLENTKFDKKQEDFLNQRVDLLESFLDLEESATSFVFKPGQVTIIDLSCPFVDANTACVLFKIGLGIYLESDSSVGRIVVVDEAHKVCFCIDHLASIS